MENKSRKKVRIEPKGRRGLFISRNGERSQRGGGIGIVNR